MCVMYKNKINYTHTLYIKKEMEKEVRAILETY